MKSIYMEQRGHTDKTEHNKFFQLDDDGHQVIATWGSIGQKRAPKVLVTSEDPAVRQAAWDKKLKEKTKRKDNPYQVIQRSDVDLSVTGTDKTVKTVLEQRPSAVGRRFGVEVETHSNLSPQDIAGKMRERGLKVNLRENEYFHSDGKNWDVKRDGSCGLEFASPILSGEAGIFDAKLVVEKIREVCPNAVNSKCGLHVTIDVSDHSHTDLKRLAIAYLKAQDYFYAQCNESRQHNQYCARNPTNRLQDMIDSSSVERVLDACGGWREHSQRYHGLNWTRVFSRKVVEFRMMESTVAMRKVGAWIRTCVGFVDGVRASHVTFKSVEPFSQETFDTICAGTWRPGTSRVEVLP
jgi:predicted DNA-binding WGR domain protein